MAQQIPLVLSTLFLFCSLHLLHQVKADSVVAMSGCVDHCGDVTIPYPFGMSSGCYLEESFRIYCENNSTGSVPTIALYNMTKLEVMHTGVEDGNIQVKFPVVHDCGGEDKYDVAVSLEGSPFAFSSTLNKFTAVGCDNLALLMQNGSTIGGCMSICDKEDDVNSGSAAANVTCSGINCCQTTIPSSLKVFNVTFQNINGDDNNKGGKKESCKYAYLVNQTWFDMYLLWNLSSAKYMDYVPVVLEWEVDYSAYAPILASRSMEQNGTSFYSLNNRTSLYNLYNRTSLYNLYNRTSLYSQTGFDSQKIVQCILYNSTVSSNTVVQCYCSKGFTGNAYVPDGCDDLDECTSIPDVCPYWAGWRCFNYYGGYDCFYTEDRKSRAKVVLLGVGVGLGVLLLAIFIWWLCKVLRKRRIEKLKQKYFKRNGGFLLQEQLSSGEVNVDKVKMFTSKELDKSTDHYNVDRMLGQGGQGTVYKGMLTNGQIVAVKKSKAIDEGNIRQFINEVVILSQINHRNVVRLLGCCLETEVPLLVYEFIPNGNLFQLIHDKNEDLTLTWDVRLRIAKEVAGALSYLHSAASIPIYHRDIKSTNILLDDKYRAKVADFGTSKSVTIDQTHVTTLVQGTFGYLDPEYFRSSQFTDKSDVYSFGVVLIELLTGQKPISSMRSGADRGLVEYFVRAMEENRLFDIIDTQVIEQGKNDEILSFAKLADRCLSWTGKERPTMKEVTMVLEDIHGKSQKALHVAQIDVDQHDIVDSYWDFGCNSAESTFEIDSASVDSSQ